MKCVVLDMVNAGSVIRKTNCSQHL